MRKTLLLIPVFFLLFVSPVSSANNNTKTDVTVLNSNEVINKDYFAFNDRVEISGTVNGDVYTAGGFVLIDGKVNGDLIVAGGQVTISGEVVQDVRVAGGQISISGKIGRNLTVGGGNVDITSEAQIAGSIVAGSGNISIAAPVGGNLMVGAGNLTISNKINGDVEAAIGQLRLTSKAIVGGDLTYLSKEDASIDSSASVVGKVTKNVSKEIDKEVRGKILGILSLFAFVVKVVNLASLFIIGLLILKFLPKFDETTERILSSKPWSSIGVGLVALIILPILSVVLMLTVVGLPIGFIILTLYGIAIFVARVFVVKLAGKLILEKFGSKGHQVWSLVVGILVYGVLTIIPVIGGLVSFFTILVGLGALLISKKEVYLSARSKHLI